jgi:hypothetical protein
MEERKGHRTSMTENRKITTGSLIKNLLSGSMITDKIILKNLGYLFLLTLLGAIYIANRFHAERVTRETERLQKEVKDLRAESLATSADLMSASKQSEVYSLVEDRGLDLEELRKPPFKLIVDRK